MSVLPTSLPTSSPTATVDTMSPKLPVHKLFRLRSKRQRSPQHPTPLNIEDVAAEPDFPSVLPCELLQAVFSFVHGPTSCAEITHAEKKMICATIVACAQVSRFWRQAARAHSPIWVFALDFQYQSLDTIVDFLHLSKAHRLVVGHRESPLRISRERDVRVLDTLYQFRHRIEEFNIKVNPLFVHMTNFLWLLNTDNTWDTFRLAGELPLVDQEKLLGSRTWGMAANRAPLRRLYLRRSNLALSPSIAFSSLTELSVHDAPVPQRLTVSQWIQVLREATQLQLLSLHDAIEPSTFLPNTWAFNPPKELRNLRLISMGDKKDSIAIETLTLFCHALLPPNCGIELALPRSHPAPLEALFTILIRELVTAITDHFSRTLNFDVFAPQIVFSVPNRPHRQAKYWATLGTVKNPEKALDWNGIAGTKGFLNLLHHTSPTSTPSRRSPILSIGIPNAEAAQSKWALSLCSSFCRNADSLRLTSLSPPSTMGAWLTMEVMARCCGATTLVLDGKCVRL